MQGQPVFDTSRQVKPRYSRTWRVYNVCTNTCFRSETGTSAVEHWLFVHCCGKEFVLPASFAYELSTLSPEHLYYVHKGDCWYMKLERELFKLSNWKPFNMWIKYLCTASQLLLRAGNLLPKTNVCTPCTQRHVWGTNVQWAPLKLTISCSLLTIKWTYEQTDLHTRR